MAKKKAPAKKTPASDSFPVLSFENANEWRKWLKKNERSSLGIWMKMAKKGAPVVTLKYLEARDEALCFGWIDSQLKSLDEHFYLQRFSPRKPKSLWSKINCGIVEKLIEEKRMTVSGLKEIEAAEADGRWDRAYDSPSTAEPSAEFLKMLANSKRAQKFWDELPRSKRYSMIWKLQTTKSDEKRALKMRKFVELLAKGDSFQLFAVKKKKVAKKVRR